MATKYSHFLQWDANEKYVSLEQTNVRLSGNIRCVICSDGRSGFESIDSTSDLASLEYKGFVSNLSQGYLTNLMTFANKLKKLNQLHSTIDIWTSTTKFVEQFNTIYNYGAYRQQNDLFNSGGLRFFAPIWTYGTLPDRFIILRVTNNLIDHVNLANQGEIVASFDLRPTSTIGKYLRTLLTQSAFTKACCEFDPETGFGWTGIDPYKGDIHTAYEHNVESYLANERTLLEEDNAVSNGWMRNNLIVHNLLNLDFSFSDPSAKYGFNTYIGLYVNEQDIDMNLLRHKVEPGGAIVSKYNSRTLIVSENQTEIKRYVPPADFRDQTNLQDWNKPVDDSIESIGSTKHIIDTEFELPDPFAWFEFKLMPVVDDHIQVIENDEILFDYTVTKNDIKATIPQTLSSIVSNMSLSNVNAIGVYAEYWQNRIIMYFPLYEKGKTNYELTLPVRAVLNKSINGDTIYAPFVHDVKVERYFTSADSFIIEDKVYEIEDAVKTYENLWYIRTNASQEELDKYEQLVYYRHIPFEYKILVPITHARFQLENEDIHATATSKIVTSFKERIAKQLYDNEYWNRSLYNYLTMSYPDYKPIPFDTLILEMCTNEDMFPKSLRESLKAANNLVIGAAETSANKFIGSIDQETGFASGTIANPYERFNENQANVSRNLNKTFPFIARMANPFGHDSELLHYYNNIALQYNRHNFVPALRSYKDPSMYTHDWFLLEGDVQEGNMLDVLRHYKAVNKQCWVTREINNGIIQSGVESYFFENAAGQKCIIGRFGREYACGDGRIIPYSIAKDSDDLTSMVKCIEVQMRDANGELMWKNDASGIPVLDENGNKIPLYTIAIPVNYDYALAFKSTTLDAYEQMEHEINCTDPSGETFKKKEHAWVYMQPMKGSTNLWSAFFMGIEYTFEGNYKDYRFAVLLVSSYKADKQFEIVENSVYKTLTLILYQYIPNSLVTTFNGKVDYTFDRLALYYSTDNMISDTDSTITTDIEFSEPFVVSFADIDTTKSYRGETRKMKAKLPGGYGNMVGQEYKEWSPFFTIDTNNPQKLVLGNNGIAYQDIDKLPLFCVTSKDVVTTDFRKDIKIETSFAWFFVLSVTDPNTGLAKQYKTVKITAQRIREVQQLYFWCEDITIELYPDGTPSIPDKKLPLYSLVVDSPDKLKDHAFYRELVKFGTMEQVVTYEGMFQVQTPTANSRYVRSLLNEWWMRIPQEMDLNDSVNSWLKPYVVAYNGTNYLTFNPNPTQYLENFVINRPVDNGGWLQNQAFDLFAHNNLWYMCDKLSAKFANTAQTISSTTKKKYESISFAGMKDQLMNNLIPFSRISKASDGGDIEQSYSKQLKISDNILTFIVSSLGYDGSKIIRQKYSNFIIWRYKFDYAPIFERLAISVADSNNLEQNMIAPKLRKRYIRQVLMHDEELYPIEDDLTLNIDRKPYWAMWNGISRNIPYAMSPTQVQNIVSKLFMYNNIFTVGVQIENGQANIIEPLYTIIGNLVFSTTMESDIANMTPEEITAACKPDVKDILPENVSICDPKMVAFERFYRDTFSKQYKCTKLVATEDNRQLDFILDDQTIMMVDTEFNGLVMLTFEQN